VVRWGGHCGAGGQKGGVLTLLFIFINPLLALAATITVISLYDCKSQPKHKGSGIGTTTHSVL